MATIDNSKTMFGVSLFKLNDEDGETEASPGPAGSSAGTAAAREAEQAARRALFFDEDGWDVPEDRITGSFPAAGAAPLATPELAAAIGLTGSQQSARASLGSGTLRFRADQLMMPEEPVSASAVPDASTSSRPYSGTVMLSPQSIAHALSGASEEAPPSAPGAAAEPEPADAPDTAQMRGLRDDEIEEARIPVESRSSTGTMRLRRSDLMAMEEGHKTTQEVDLSFLASTTGARRSHGESAPTRAPVGAESSGGGSIEGGSAHGQPQWATMPVGVVVEPPDDVIPPTGEHCALDVESDQFPISSSTERDDGLTSEFPPLLEAPSTPDTAAPIGGSAVADEARTSTPSPTAPVAAAASPPLVDPALAPAPVVESRRPAVTQPTQLMPALTLPPSIAGERDQVLDRLVAPTRPSTPPAPSTDAGPYPWLIVLFIVAAIAVLTLAAFFVLR